MIITGTPSGKKRIKKFSLCNITPIMLIQTNTPIEIYKVIIKWLVIVKLYGNIPTILFIKINSNKKKKIKIKKYLFKLIVCLIVDCTNR